MFDVRRESLLTKCDSYLCQTNEQDFVAVADGNLESRNQSIMKYCCVKEPIPTVTHLNVIAGICQRYLGLLVM